MTRKDTSALEQEDIVLESGTLIPLVCEYSARHRHEGVTATAILDCGPVGMIPACEKCADFFTRQVS